MNEAHSTPVWDDVPLPRFETLTHDVTIDVAIVGAGLTGITTACLLQRAGLRVALLDRRAVGGTDTACTTAHLTAVADTDLSTLARTFGPDHAQAVWDAGFAAIDQIDRLASAYGIDCELERVPGFRHLPFDMPDEAHEKALEQLRDEARLASAMGFDVEMVPSTPLVDRPGWRVEEQALFHPQKYLRGLLRHLASSGAVICERCSASLSGGPETLSCGAYKVRAPYVVIATHSPSPGLSSGPTLAWLQTKVALYTTYALAATAPSTPNTPSASYWDISDPYRYIRVDTRAGTRRFIVGGEDHKTGQETDTRAPFAALERWFRALVPTAAIAQRWSGQVIATTDGLPFIGEVGEKHYIATGFAGNGMTLGTLSAMMIHDAIVGRVANPWRDLFAPDRPAIARGPLSYFRENADYPYYMVRDRFAGQETREIRRVPRGEGRLVEVDGRVMAASRDDRGRLTVLSSTCTHLGCRVSWNRAEGTWDCPCHGSRFTATGEVLAGPAQENLARVDPR